MFYDNLILSGTKIKPAVKDIEYMFYDNLILSGTKISNSTILCNLYFIVM